MTFPTEKSPLQVGFTDALRGSAGVLLPAYLLTAASLTTLAELLGVPFVLSGPITLTCGVIIVVALELVRRHVLTTRPSGRGMRTVALFRGAIRVLLWAALPTTAFVLAGILTHCFGQACGDTDRIILIVMLVWSVIAVALLPMGYRLLTRAEWLRPRAG